MRLLGWDSEVFVTRVPNKQLKPPQDRDRKVDVPPAARVQKLLVPPYESRPHSLLLLDFQARHHVLNERDKQRARKAEWNDPRGRRDDRRR